MNSSNFMNTVKENIRVVNLLAFALCAIFLILPIYGGASAISLLFSFSFWAIFLFIAPAFGLVYLFVLSKNKTRKQHALYLGITHIAGLALMFITKGMIFSGSYYGYNVGAFIPFGFFGILSILVYIAGIGANGIAFFDK